MPHITANPAPRLSTTQVAQLYGCSLNSARRIGAQHGGPALQAVDPATGKRTNYYPAEPLLAHHAATQQARSCTTVPTGYTTAAKLAEAGISWTRLRSAMRHCPIRTMRGYSPAKRLRTYYCTADVRRAVHMGYIRPATH